jgi:diguanylate cyclase (GGDEF)-like protein/PAS domain S-box-containing protein
LGISILIRLFLIAAVYFMTGWLGLQMPFSGTHITLIWIPAGVAVAAFFLWGRSVWPAIYIGAFLVNFSVGSIWPLAAAIAVGNTLAPLLASVWLKRLGFHARFDRQKDVGIFIATAGFGMMVSATCGVISLALAQVLPYEALGFAWFSWWMGDAVGVLLAAPLLLTFTQKNLVHLLRERRTLLLWFAIAGPAAWLAFVQDYASVGHALPLAFITIPLFAWAALRFGVSGAGLAGLGFSVVAAWGTANGHGTFHTSNVHISLFLLWIYMACTVLTGLLITSLQAERLKMQGALIDSEKQLHALTESRQAILDCTNFSIIATDTKGVIQIFNRSAERMLGYSADELVGQQTPSILHDTDEVRQRAANLSLELSYHVEPGFEVFVAKARLHKEPDEHEWTYIRKNGSRFPVLLSVTALLDAQGEITGYLGVAIDISERKRQENRLRDSEEMFRVLYESSSDAHMIATIDEGFTGGNMAAAHLFGCRDIDEFLHLSPETTSPEFQPDGSRSDQQAQKMMQLALQNGVHSFEWLHKRVDDSVFSADVLLTRITIGGKYSIQATVRDISLRKAADEEISHLAFFDALTGLPNRRLLLDRLRQALATARRTGSEGALMFIDLDHFKNLNDTFGHDMGDILLQKVANRISLCVREADTVARIGGDEFVVILENLSADTQEAATQAKIVGEKILNALRQSFEVGGHQHQSTASIGVTLFTDFKDSIEELLKRADLAMYQAKSAGRNALNFFNPAIQAAVIAHLALEADLRKGLLRNEFILYYQAQVSRKNQVTGVEVLVRWMHPQHGMIPPARFIGLAEETGLILPLGDFVLETACHQLAAWASQPVMAQLTIAVNVSAYQFRSVDYVKSVFSILEKTGADPYKLKLEITESMLLDDIEGVIEKMTLLQAHGIRFSLDDFGTGYSSLAYLKRLPLDQLKIDQSFVRDVLADQNDATIARTIITLGQSLGLNVIAEGVETEEQREFLALHNCHAYQGYLFSRPLPLVEFENFMSR